MVKLWPKTCFLQVLGQMTENGIQKCNPLNTTLVLRRSKHLITEQLNTSFRMNPVIICPVQWGSEYQTFHLFECWKVVQTPNGSDFKSHSKYGL